MIAFIGAVYDGGCNGSNLVLVRNVLNDLNVLNDWNLSFPYTV